MRKQQLSTLDDLIKARFVEMFGDPVLNPNNYPVHQLSDYIEFLTSGSRGWAQYCVDDGAEWFITIKNVKDCRISVENIQPISVPDNAEARRTRVQEGDLLISITADLGRTGVVTKEIAEHGAYINQHLTCIRLVYVFDTSRQQYKNIRKVKGSTDPSTSSRARACRNASAAA